MLLHAPIYFILMDVLLLHINQIDGGRPALTIQQLAQLPHDFIVAVTLMIERRPDSCLKLGYLVLSAGVH